MSLVDDFKQAAEDVQTLTKRPSNDDLLQLYSLFKQAEVGEVTGKRPGALNVVGRRKWDQWAALKGMAQDEAMQKYITKVKDLQSLEA